MFLYGGSKPPPYAQNPNIANKQNKNYTSVFLQRTDFTHARPAFIAGVQTMRARICPAFSCDMFARVVWLRLQRVAKPRLSIYPVSHALATHGSRD